SLGFQDVLSNGRNSPVASYKKLQGWSSDQNKWNEKLYPFWEEDDLRWKDCWKGGKVTAKLVTDSPALVGSNVTFVVTLQFPKCQEEDNDGNIIYQRNCTPDSPASQDQYVYNWTEWIDSCSWENCTSNHSHNVFPDGRPFPHYPGWRRRNFVYLFHTFGQYHQTIGRSSVIFSVNTANITLGKHIMAVSIYRRGHSTYVPIARARTTYVVTGEYKIPIFVSMSQKHDRNISDSIFIKDSPITFAVKIHDPSYYLNNSAISYKWNFGDGSGLFVASSAITSHTYALQGNFTLNLTVQAIIPVPCRPVTPTPPLPTSAELILKLYIYFSSFNPTVTTEASSNSDSSATVETMEDNPDGGCHIYRYGYYRAGISIVEGILEVNIIQMTSIQMTESQAENSLVDFVVTCQGSLPTDACTAVSDPTCQVSQSVVCDPITTTDECLVTIRRAFDEPGTYCINITLGDDTSQALASALISVNGGKPAQRSSSGTTKGVFIFLGLLAVFAAVGAFVLYKRYKQYKPIERSAGQAENQEGLSAYFSNFKAIFFPRSTERNPLLKSKPGIV
ncbi:QNR71 protein, partial [Chauna torquata]|nr:QNR71 protein [Chauna torquata]